MGSIDAVKGLLDKIVQDENVKQSAEMLQSMETFKELDLKLLLCFLSIGFLLGTVLVLMTPSTKSSSKGSRAGPPGRPKTLQNTPIPLPHHLKKPLNKSWGHEPRKTWNAPTGPEADSAARTKPAQLVGRWLVVKGYDTPGKVASFNYKYIGNSHHVVSFLAKNNDTAAGQRSGW